MNARGTILIAALALVAAIDVRSAQMHSESFPGGGAVSQSGLSLGGGSWAFTGGAARVNFVGTLPVAIPDIATVRPSSGAFTGNYAAAGIGVIGFRFRAETELPSSLYLEVEAGTSVYQRIFRPTQVGAWQYFMASLEDAHAGGWSVKQGDASSFRSELTNVKSLTVKIGRSGATARQYAIDDLFIDGLPQASAPGSGAVVGSLAWDYLQVGAPYMLQESSSLQGPWTDKQSVVATNRLHHVPMPQEAGAPQRFFRLRGP